MPSLKAINWLIFFLILTPAIILGQIQKEKGISIEGTIIASSFKPIVLTESIDFEEKEMFSPQFELKVGKHFQNNIIIQLGLRYSNISFNYFASKLIDFDENSTVEMNEESLVQRRTYYFQNSFGQVNVDSEVKYFRFSEIPDPKKFDVHEISLRSTNSVNQIGLPIEIKKKFGEKDLKFTLFGGIAGNYLFATKVNIEKYRQSGFKLDDRRGNEGIVRSTIILEENSEISKNGINKITLDINCGFGFEHKGDRNTFLMEGYYARNITPISASESGNRYIESLGLKVGLRYSLN